MVHSIIIGISLGVSQSPNTIKPLVAALTFHQFFEGMGLGGCISQVFQSPPNKNLLVFSFVNFFYPKSVIRIYRRNIETVLI